MLFRTCKLAFVYRSKIDGTSSQGEEDAVDVGSARRAHSLPLGLTIAKKRSEYVRTFKVPCAPK